VKGDACYKVAGGRKEMEKREHGREGVTLKT
jgi:hypothetical protein